MRGSSKDKFTVSPATTIGKLYDIGDESDQEPISA
jgi:hypothetical protein